MDIRGHVVRRLWIERSSDIASEYYFSITFDRSAKRPLLMLTTQGGVEIEQVAAETPELLARLHVDPLVGLQPFHARRLLFGAGLPAEQHAQGADIIARAYRAFIETDAMLVEINPLIVTPEGELRALDSKYTVDDNALFRHPDIAEMRDLESLDPQERMARERGVTYVKLDGTIGILGNGAGLVMSTLDVVAQAGGTPANFLDVGGGAQADEIVSAHGGAAVRQQGARRPLQRLRRHHPLRRGRPRRADGARPAGCVDPGRRPPGRHQRRRGPRRSWPTRRRPTWSSRETMLGAAEQRRRAGGSGLMAIVVTAETRLLVQGITGREGSFHASRNRDYGTRLVAGVTPGKGGQEVDRHPRL